MVVIGVPEQPVYVPAEEGVTKIGGRPNWLCGPAEILDSDKCKTCGCSFELLVSADCPVDDDFDRILYFFICPKCGQDGRVIRQKKPVSAKEAAVSTALFTQENISGKSDIMAALSAFNAPQTKTTKKGKKQRPNKEIGRWPGFYIETFDEPEAQLPPDMDVVISTSVDSTSDINGGEEDKLDVTVSPELVEYNERMSRCPDQVLRYSRFGEPLLQEKMEINVPKCPHCGGERAFEFEILPTIIFILEPESPMDFGPILVYTCKGDCGGQGTYQEHCIISPP